MTPQRRPRCTARTAVFLLFAAALVIGLAFGATSAEASLPRAADAVAPDAAATHSPASRAVTRELVVDDALEHGPDPALRLGFAEELCLLEPDQAQAGFVLFERETRRCERTYARNNPLKFVDPDGLAWVVFNQGTNTLSIYGKNRSYGSYLATNRPRNGVLTDGRPVMKPIRPGRYPFLDTRFPNLHGLPDDAPGGRFGIYGIFRLKAFRDETGELRTGVGIHAGRYEPGKFGYDAKTEGCIRTCEDVMSILVNVAKDDPLEYLEVVRGLSGSTTEAGPAYMGSLGAPGDVFSGNSSSELPGAFIFSTSSAGVASGGDVACAYDDAACKARSAFGAATRH